MAMVGFGAMGVVALAFWVLLAGGQWRALGMMMILFMLAGLLLLGRASAPVRHGAAMANPPPVPVQVAPVEVAPIPR